MDKNTFVTVLVAISNLLELCETQMFFLLLLRETQLFFSCFEASRDANNLSPASKRKEGSTGDPSPVTKSSSISIELLSPPTSLPVASQSPPAIV